MHTITRIQCGNGNCFCVEEDGNTILIDTARTAYRDKILAAYKNKNVRLIVLTHGHIDHIQNAAALSKALNAPVAIHKDDALLIGDNASEPMLAHTLLGKLALALTVRSFKRDKVEPFEPDVFLTDGDTLDAYGVKATVIGLPGHTKGSIGVLIGDSDIFVGDALMNLVYPTKSMLYGNREDMIQSAAKVSAYTFATVHFGHGKSVENRMWC